MNYEEDKNRETVMCRCVIVLTGTHSWQEEKRTNDLISYVAYLWRANFRQGCTSDYLQQARDRLN